MWEARAVSGLWSQVRNVLDPQESVLLSISLLSLKMCTYCVYVTCVWVCDSVCMNTHTSSVVPRCLVEVRGNLGGVGFLFPWWAMGISHLTCPNFPFLQNFLFLGFLHTMPGKTDIPSPILYLDLVCLFEDRVSYSPRWPQTHCGLQWPQTSHPCVSLSQALGLQVCSTNRQAPPAGVYHDQACTTSRCAPTTGEHH